jgi:hypothetical protein
MFLVYAIWFVTLATPFALLGYMVGRAAGA